jgi:hypothetical protein
MLSKLGHKVMSLNRIAVGPISLKGLATGECRPLSRQEVDLLREVATGADSKRPRSFGSGSGSRPRHDSRRPRRGEHPRGRRDDGRPQQQRPRAGAERHGPSPGPAPTRPSRRGTSPSEGLDRPRPRIPHGRQAKTELPMSTKLKTSPPAETSRADSATPLNPRPTPSRRRIIGLERQPAPPAEGAISRGGRSRKRPPARRARPPGASLRKRASAPSEPGGLEGGGA